MSNPLVVFVNKDLWPTSPLTLPAGWMPDGSRLDGLERIRDRSVCLLLLDDNRPVPDCSHSNRDPSKPLPLIVHGNSRLHRKDRIGDDKHHLLRSWGRPMVQAHFSHEDEHADAVRTGIKALLADSRLAPAFASKYHIEHELDLLDGLASVCVAAMLDVDFSAAARWEGLVQQLPDETFKAGLSQPQNADWNDRLGRLVARADALVAGSPSAHAE